MRPPGACVIRPSNDSGVSRASSIDVRVLPFGRAYIRSTMAESCLTVVAENLLWIFCFANSNNAEAASCEVNCGLWNLLKNQYQPVANSGFDAINQ